jgi:hypothetical protein
VPCIVREVMGAQLKVEFLDKDFVPSGILLERLVHKSKFTPGVNFHCKECRSIFLRKLLAVNHKVKMHKNTDFADVFEGTKKEVRIEAMAPSLDVEVTVAHYANQALAPVPEFRPCNDPTEETVVADLSECLM